MAIVTEHGDFLANAMKLLTPKEVEARWLEIMQVVRVSKPEKYLWRFTSLEQFHSRLVDGYWQMWLCYSGGRPHLGVLTEIAMRLTQDGEERIGRVLWIGGKEARRATYYVPYVHAWFTSLGCKYVEVHARRGLVPKLAEHGYELEQFIMRRRLP